MPTYRAINHINGQPCYEKTFDQIKDEVIAEIMACPKDGAFTFESMPCAKYVSGQQRKWYKGICLPWLESHPTVNRNRESRYWWDDEVKRLCRGLDLLRKDVFFTQGLGGQKIPTGRLTITGVSVTNMRIFINEILAKSVEKGWGVAEPDKELKEKPKKK